jgi:heptosyltransferase-2/heptosyltransferase-3
MHPPATYPPLVVRFGAFGDMVLMIPMLKVLAHRYGQPCDLVSSGRWTPPLMERVSACGHVRLVTSRKAIYWFNASQRELTAWLRSRPAGPVYVFEADDKTHWLLRRGGVRPEWICTLRDLPRQRSEHIADQALRLCRETPAALRDAPGFALDPKFAADASPTLTDADRRDCQEWISRRGLTGAPLVLIQSGNKKTMKGGDRQRKSNVDYWPEANWAAVVSGVRQLLPASRVILCGSPAERPLAEDILARVTEGRDGVVVATDDLPIPRLLALQAVAHSMITVNTGPAHSAAAMGCPQVALFTRHAHRAADLYAPRSTTAPVRLLHPASAAADAGLDSIRPAAVLAAWRELAGL